MVNYLAILVATIAAYIVGALWYSVLFGKQWRHLMETAEGTTHHHRKLTRGQSMVGGFLSTLVLIYVFAKVVSVISATDAIACAIVVSVGIIAMTQLNSVWYENRPWKLFFINAGHYVAALIVAALVLYYW